VLGKIILDELLSTLSGTQNGFRDSVRIFFNQVIVTTP
jgi:hypothetical protein